MKNILHIVGLLSICCMIGCRGKGGYDWAGKEIELTCQNLKADTTLIGSYNYCVFPESIIVQVSSNNASLHYYQIMEDSLCWRGKMLYQGKGPDELLYPMCLQYHNGDTPILKILGSYSENKMFDIRMDHTEDFFNTQHWEKSRIFGHAMGFETIGIVDSISFLTISTMESQKDMFAFFSTRDSVLISTGYSYPDDGIVASPIVKALIYAGTVTRRPGGAEFIYSCVSGKYSFIFYLDNQHRVTIKHDLYDSYPKYTVAEDGLNCVYTSESDEGFVQTVTQDYIYLGDCSRTIGDRYPGYPTGFFDEVLVFDWDGNPSVKYSLDCPVAKIVVDTNGDFLYGFTVDPTTGTEQFVRFNLTE